MMTYSELRSRAAVVMTSPVRCKLVKVVMKLKQSCGCRMRTTREYSNACSIDHMD